jgi:acyl-CoA thioesterase-1
MENLLISPMNPFRTRYGPYQHGFNAARRRVRRALHMFVCAAAAWSAAAGVAPAAEPPVVVAFGDSLTAGYGVADRESFPARLSQALAARGIAARVINAGVSGDTSAGGRARLDWMLADRPDMAIVELGANDGLRGLEPATTYGNLDAILTRLDAAGVAVLLAGMLAPPNLGAEYGDAFNAVYPRLAAKHDVVFYPFFLDGVAARPRLNQADGIHPNAAGVDAIVARILPYVVEALGRAGAQ